jgi:hypothetical protein
VLTLAAPDNPARGAQRFRDAVMSGDGEESSLPRGAILGDDEFIARLQVLRRRASREVPRREGRRSLDDIFRGAQTRKARDLAIAVASRERFAFAEIGRYLGLHTSTVSRIALRQVSELE